MKVDEDGTVEVSAFKLPLSAALSPQYRELLVAMLSNPLPLGMPFARDFESEADFRAAVDAFREILDESWRARARTSAGQLSCRDRAGPHGRGARRGVHAAGARS